MENTQTTRRTSRNRVLDAKKTLGAVAVALGLSFFGGRAAQAQATTQEAEGNVEIQIGSGAANEKAVMQGDSMLCHIRLTGAGKDMNIVLVSPPISGTNNLRRLTFSVSGVTNNADGSLPLTLTKDGAWKDFFIGGYIGSAQLFDAPIEAHKDSASGSLKTTTVVSVGWVSSSHMDVQQGGTYQFDGSLRYTVTGTAAVYLLTQAVLTPAGVSSYLPNTASLGLGFVQNISSPSYVKSWGNPTPLWTNDALPADTITRGEKFFEVRSFSGVANDTVSSIAPLYTSPASMSSGISASNDTPTTGAATTTKSVAVLISGRYVADIIYQSFLQARITASFTDWCVTYDIPNKSVRSPLKENSWSLSVDSTLSDQKASVGAEHSVSSSPNVSTTVSANDLINSPANLFRGFSGNSVTWVKGN